jgi:hypothetical protein
MFKKRAPEDSGDGRTVSTNHPLHGEPRPRWTPYIGVALMIVVVLAIFALITWLRYHT